MNAIADSYLDTAIITSARIELAAKYRNRVAAVDTIPVKRIPWVRIALVGALTIACPLVGLTVLGCAACWSM